MSLGRRRTRRRSRDREAAGVGRVGAQQGDRERRMIVQVVAHSGRVDAAAEQEGGRVERACREDHQRRLDLLATDEPDAPRRPAREEHDVDQRLAADREVRPRPRRGHVCVPDGHPATRGVACEVDASGCVRHRLRERGADRAPLVPCRTVQCQGRPRQPRCDRAPSPPVATEVALPLVVVLRLPRQREHRIDRRRSADAATAQVRLGGLTRRERRLEPLPLPSWRGHGVGEGRAPAPALVRAGLEEEDVARRVFAQACREDGAGRASADNDHVGAPGRRARHAAAAAVDAGRPARCAASP